MDDLAHVGEAIQGIGFAAVLDQPDDTLGNLFDHRTIEIAQRKPRLDSLSRLGRGVMVTLTALIQTDSDVSFEAALGAVQERAKEWATGELFERDVSRRAGRLAFMN